MYYLIPRILLRLSVVFMAAALMAGVFLPGSASADSWNKYSLRAYSGVLGNAGTLKNDPEYQGSELGGDTEIGLSCAVLLDPRYDIELGIARISAAGTQRAAPSNPDQRDILTSLDYTRLDITGRLRRKRPDAHFVPWIGAGVSVGMIDATRQSITSSGGLQALERGDSTAFGFHAIAGLEIYPMRDSALALDIQVRYAIIGADGAVNFEQNSHAVLFGLRWDFWTSTAE